MPSVASATQVSLAVHWTAVTAAAPVGVAPSVQVWPPSRVEITAPAVAVAPTARQSSFPVHETPASAVTEAGTNWLTQVSPPSRDADTAAVVPVPNPTAQQWATSPHDTAVALFIGAGAGWPVAT